MKDSVGVLNQGEQGQGRHLSPTSFLPIKSEVIQGYRKGVFESKWCFIIA